MLVNIEVPPSHIIDKTGENYKVFLKSVREHGVLQPVLLAIRGNKYHE